MVIRNGKMITCKWLSLFILLRNKETHFEDKSNFSPSSRLGIIVKKKDLKLATKRNVFKRVAREFFRSHRDSFKEPCDVVIRTEKKPERTDSAFYHEEIKKVFEKGKIIS
ncbi:MAG: ribonuclease P protein component [Candidatus Omnitrophica bacterium]|nr:ribonuclease P protein component [Candidatus Omnitrophota bacterium]